jgi:hypothetical protein
MDNDDTPSNVPEDVGGQMNWVPCCIGSKRHGDVSGFGQRRCGWGVSLPPVGCYVPSGVATRGSHASWNLAGFGQLSYRPADSDLSAQTTLEETI